MKVKELISKLEKFDKDAEVLCYSEKHTDEDIVSMLYMIDDVSIAEGEKRRDANGKPIISFGKGSASVKCVLISIESDF